MLSYVQCACVIYFNDIVSNISVRVHGVRICVKMAERHTASTVANYLSTHPLGQRRLSHQMTYLSVKVLHIITLILQLHPWRQRLCLQRRLRLPQFGEKK